MDQIQPYIDYFSAHPAWALAFVFLIAFGEALLIIGLFVPSTVALVSAGMLVGTGHLDFWPVFWATALGAILGDQLSYWVGRLYGDKLKTMWPLNHYPALVDKGEKFVRQHGGKSIAIGRFVPGVKAVVPGIVGMLGMNQPFFIFVNVTSGLVWTAAHVFPGILLGQGLALAGDLSGQLVVVLIVLLVVLGLASWLIRHLAGRLHPVRVMLMRRVSIWARSSKSRSLNRFGKAIAPGNPRAAALLFLLVVGVASLIFMIDIVSGFVIRNAASNLDLSIATLMSELRNAPADDLMIPLTMLSERPVVWTMGLALAVWLVAWRGWRVAVLMLAIMAFAEFASINLNHLTASAGTQLHGGFTSTPMLMSGLVFGFISVLAGHSMGHWSKAIVAATCGSIAVAIAFSRVYLGSEWLSGILVGGLLALVLTALFGVAIEAIPARRIRPYGLLAFASVIFLLAGAFHIDHGLDRATKRYAAKSYMETFTEDTWRSGAWQNLEPRRIDLAGRTEEVFTAQWIGSLSLLQKAMQDQKWKPLPSWRWQDAFFYLDAKANLDRLPPRPVLHKGLKAKLTMTLEQPGNPNRRLVLRAFKSHALVTVNGQTEPVYLLSITPEVARSRLHLYAMPATQPAIESETELALASLGRVADVTVLAENTDGTKPAKVLLARP